MLPLLLVSMDVSVRYFAIPGISADLDPGGTQQLWIFDIYGFVLAGLLMTMGAVGDRIGRRRLLLLGAAAFGAASLHPAYAHTAETLSVARAVLGIGGATLMPSTMAPVRTMFTDPSQRAKAIGLWSGAMTAGIALGSVMSGVLVEHFWWDSVFLVNLPAMALLLVLGPLLLPESRNPSPGRFDLLSVPLAMAAVLPVVYGLKKLPSEGWNVRYVVSITVGLLFAALWSLLPSVLIGVATPVAARLVQRSVERAYVVTAGFATGAVGYVLTALAGADRVRRPRRPHRRRDVPAHRPRARLGAGREGGRGVVTARNRHRVRRRVGHGRPRFHRYGPLPPRHAVGRTRSGPGDPGRRAGRRRRPAGARGKRPGAGGTRGVHRRDAGRRARGCAGAPGGRGAGGAGPAAHPGASAGGHGKRRTG